MCSPPRCNIALTSILIHMPVRLQETRALCLVEIVHKRQRMELLPDYLGPFLTALTVLHDLFNIAK